MDPVLLPSRCVTQCVDGYLADDCIVVAGGVKFCGIKIESGAASAMSALGCGCACRRSECGARGCCEQEAQYWNYLASA